MLHRIWFVWAPVLLLVCLGAATCAAADPGAEQYAAAVAADKDLVALWRFEGDLKAAKGKADGEARGGQPRFGPGPRGGKALVLAEGRYVTMGETPELDLKPATVELWFKPTFKPGGVRYNPCIVAKRADDDHRSTRLSIHIWGDYSCLAVWNGRSVLRCFVGDGPLVKDRWYHLAVTCDAGPMKVYANGVLCDTEGPQATFNFLQQKRPLSIGSSQPKGAELLACDVDEVAFYRRALSEEEIAAHVDAMGFKEQREKLAAARQQRVRREEAQRAILEAQREKLRQEMLDDPALLARGEPMVHRGKYLEAVSLPLGGIGTGSIQINGRGELATWQIFNNFKHATVPHSFLAIRATSGGKPVVRALQTTPVGPFAAMKSLSFRGAYPFGWYRFEDPELPVKVSLEAFNPLVPLDAKSSAIPCAIFNVTVENPGQRPVEVAILASQQNAVGYLGDEAIKGRSYRNYGGNVTEVLVDRGATVLSMRSGDPKPSPGYGSMALMTMGEGATGAASYESLEKLAGSFAAEGKLAGPEKAGPSPDEETLDGALAVSLRLAPGGKRTVPFVLAWHFPNAQHGAGAWKGGGNMYATRWPDALSVAAEVRDNLDELTCKTRLYHQTLYASNLPCWLVERIGSQVAVLRSQTCFWAKDGYFGGWEGCCRERGCCHGNCNHVWHYAQAHARLFPKVARQMRVQEYKFQADDGAIPHRQPKSHPAFDGQCGAVLNSYREYCTSADRKWLDAHWPAVKKAMDYTIARWDKDEDGVLAGPQWNTLDGALDGSSSWLGTLYLAALAAAEKMALLEKDVDSATRYAAIRKSGSNKQDETLFNGEYYYQILGPAPHEDYGTGCHVDQVLGQWWAHQLDLGWLYPPDRVRTALGSLFKYNFRAKLQGLRQAPRKFVADYDPGTQMITWPKGPRPAKVIRYGDEVMTGFEYSAAAAMVQAGLLREGFTVARAVWTRYDGRLRTELTGSDTASWGYSGNPFGDDECGKFYARAMSVWSMLLACQGYVYEGPAAKVGFRPVWKPEDHKTFFTAAEGWGLFSQKRAGGLQTERIEVRFGRLRVKTLLFQLPEGAKPQAVTVHLGDRQLEAKHGTKDGDVQIELTEPVVVETGGALEIEIKHKPISSR